MGSSLLSLRELVVSGEGRRAMGRPECRRVVPRTHTAFCMHSQPHTPMARLDLHLAGIAPEALQRSARFAIEGKGKP